MILEFMQYTTILTDGELSSIMHERDINNKNIANLMLLAGKLASWQAGKRPPLKQEKQWANTDTFID